MADGLRVLIVDAETETEQVLKAVLEPRGLQVDRVRRLNSQPSPTPPSVLVIDDDQLSAEIRRGNGWSGVPRVVIGSAKFAGESTADAGQYLQKPFQYPELVRLVDQLLTDRAA